MGRPTLYDWDLLLDGEPHTLYRTDPESTAPLKDNEYDANPLSFRSAAVNAATRRNLKVTLMEHIDGFVIQAYDPKVRRKPKLTLRDVEREEFHIPEGVKRCIICNEPLPPFYADEYDECQIIDTKTWRITGPLHEEDASQ